MDWLRRPDVLCYLRDLWLSSGGLAILYPSGMAMALPSLAINAFANSDWMHSGGAHYSAAIVPFLVISAVNGVDWAAEAIGRRIGRPGDRQVRRVPAAAGPETVTRSLAYERTAVILVGLGLAVALANHNERGVLPLSRRFVLKPISEHARRAQPFIEQVNDLPPEVPISVGSNLYSHVSHRQRVYLLPTVSDAEVVLLDVTGPPFPVGSGDQVQIVQQLLEYDHFGVARADAGVLLLARNLDSYQWPAQFYGAFQGGDSTPSYRVGADLGSLLRLEGFDWSVQPVVTPKPLIEVTTYWRVLSPMDEGCRLLFNYLDSEGRVVGMRPEELAASWYPLWRWEPGQVVKATLPPSPLGDVHHLGVALLRPGADPADTGGRVAPITSTSDLTLTLWERGTIVELVRR